jgi:hypothetical protein
MWKWQKDPRTPGTYSWMLVPDPSYVAPVTPVPVDPNAAYDGSFEWKGTNTQFKKGADGTTLYRSQGNPGWMSYNAYFNNGGVEPPPEAEPAPTPPTGDQSVFTPKVQAPAATPAYPKQAEVDAMLGKAGRGGKDTAGRGGRNPSLKGWTPKMPKAFKARNI